MINERRGTEYRNGNVFPEYTYDGQWKNDMYHGQGDLKKTIYYTKEDSLMEKNTVNLKHTRSIGRAVLMKMRQIRLNKCQHHQTLVKTTFMLMTLP